MHRRFLFSAYSIFSWITATFAQPVTLTARYVEPATAVISWNLPYLKTAADYNLLKSTDGKKWSQLAKGKCSGKYGESSQVTFSDHIDNDSHYLYRFLITDKARVTNASSQIVTLTIVETTQAWKIYPNPVPDVLHLDHEGRAAISGVINVIIQDAGGKIVTRFRASSMNKKIEIPVSQLRKGVYFLQATILGEAILKQTFIKQ